MKPGIFTRQGSLVRYQHRPPNQWIAGGGSENNPSQNATLSHNPDGPRHTVGHTTVLGLIPARGGSKRVPRKNIRPLLGKPLIVWTIEEARKSRLITRLMVSTEDPEVMKVAGDYGCDVLVRPMELATDDASSLDVVRHAVDALCRYPDRGGGLVYEYVCLLQPTSPFRTVADIDETIDLAVRMEHHCITTSERNLVGPPPRPNGLVYVWRCDSIQHACGLFAQRGLDRDLDIDTESDFQEAERILRARDKIRAA